MVNMALKEKELSAVRSRLLAKVADLTEKVEPTMITIASKGGVQKPCGSIFGIFDPPPPLVVLFI